MFESARDWLILQGLDGGLADPLLRVALGLGAIVVAVLARLVMKRIVRRGIARVVQASAVHWDDVLLERGVVDHLLRLVPPLVLQLLLSVPLVGMPDVYDVVRSGLHVYMLLIAALVVDAALDAALAIYRRYPVAKRFELQSIVQFLKVGLYLLIGILVLSILVNRSPLAFLGGLGAMTAVLLLVFKDAILGFVAGIQLTTNDMVRRGDWIEMPKYGADGTVLEIALTTVKVQNWDKTVTTIPTYALISDAFRNWRGMEESGGRRIKRSLAIDMTTVRICDDRMLERFRRIAVLREYVDRKRTELAEWNARHGTDDDEPVNGRRLTNLGTFRAYVEAYLRQHAQVHTEMTFLVRQLQPTERGVPIEIYVFSKDQRWAHYEAIQADIFDHIIAVVPEFGLRVFQEPTGLDLRDGLRRVS